jgi:hypothetical protein
MWEGSDAEIAIEEADGEGCSEVTDASIGR